MNKIPTDNIIEDFLVNEMHDPFLIVKYKIRNYMRKKFNKEEQEDG